MDEQGDKRAKRDHRTKKSAKAKKVPATSNVVELHPANLIEDQGFIVDLCRFRENLLDEKSIRKKYRLANAVWEKLADDDELIRKVEEESVRRIRDGSNKRERSQQLITKAPLILDSIASDVSASPRHRVDAIKTLDGMAANPGDSVPAADRFIIQINLGADVHGKEIIERYNKPFKPLSPGEIDPDDVDSTDVIAAITMKPTESGGGENTI